MKAVLVIENMPKNCDVCSLQRWGIDGWNCMPKNKTIEDDDKPEWCPLKPLPQKQEHKEGLCSDYILGFEDGWNDCLKEIAE